MAIQLISVGLSIMESLRNPARWLRNEPGLLSVISQERPDEMLLRAGIDRDLAGASAWLAAALESPAACGYLVVQARDHGVAGRSFWRAVAVAAIGAAHALMVSLIGLVVVAPAFVADGGELALTWHHPRYGHAGTVLLLATAWCLAVGVFSQILWDDRPITAPLAHLSWRSGR